MKILIVNDMDLYHASKRQLSMFHDVDILYSPFNHTSFSHMVFTLPEELFYADVTKERLPDIIMKSADDLLIQSADLHDVSNQVKKYDLLTKTVVQLCLKHLQKQTPQNIQDWEHFIAEINVRGNKIEDLLRLVLLNTVIGPDLSKILYGLGRPEVKRRLEAYLHNARNRF